ncbi:MAG: phenylacetate--CoA ligase family protein, partial [Mangrovimonas sp.]|nr:phenylacetate--CoA ligase family protein [Mangrovimonas sp.]
MIPNIEKASPEEIKKFQEEKLRETLAYVSLHSPYYKRLFSEHTIDPSKISCLEDLKQIPPTTKADIQKYNDDFICVPKEQLIDYVTTSGTLGDPVTFALTDKDLERLAYNEALSFACSGVRSNHVLQLMTTIDRRFMAGLAYFL